MVGGGTPRRRPPGREIAAALARPRPTRAVRDGEGGDGGGGLVVAGGRTVGRSVGRAAVVWGTTLFYRAVYVYTIVCRAHAGRVVSRGGGGGGLHAGRNSGRCDDGGARERTGPRRPRRRVGGDGRKKGWRILSACARV